LESALRIEGLLIRIVNIYNKYKTKSDVNVIPISDTIFHTYDLNYGENLPVYCVREPDPKPELFRKTVDELSLELTIKEFIGEGRRVNNLMLRRQKIDVQIENASTGEILFVVKYANVEEFCRKIENIATRRKIYLSCNNSLKNYVNTCDVKFSWEIIPQYPVMESSPEYRNPKESSKCLDLYSFLDS
jgi:hypothetical protein